MVIQSHNYINLKIILFSLILLLSCHASPVFGQTITYKVFYRIYFKDKGPVNINDFSPNELLSVKAMERREKAGVPVPDYRDLPVYSGYLDQISALGFKLHCTSKWMNTALFKTDILYDISILIGLPFVKDVKIVKDLVTKNSAPDKLYFETARNDLPPYDQPILMLNGQSVHSSGFNGTGILIAVLDGGFDNAENISSLVSLRNRQGVKGTYDFVSNNEDVYGFHTHGTAVLSVLAGNISGSIVGSAQGADYWLLRSEDTSSEFPVEEDFWAAAAEFADSVGADIISSSLGYYAFDDNLLSYKFSDMDGNSTFVTQAADIAAAKGILVVSSAGNERNKEWKHIIAPSDGDSVLAVGAVDWSETISTFSSAGPSYDLRVKPDVVSQGVSVPVQVKTSVVERSNGTSFSCPVISGMSACIMQAVPQAINTDIISVLHSGSDRYFTPDSLYGYGIPDIAEAISLLQEKYLSPTDNESIVGPNPFLNHLRITFREVPGQLVVELFDTNGKLLKKLDFNDYVSRSLILNDFRDLKNGMYFLRLKTSGGTFIHKVIRINNQ